MRLQTNWELVQGQPAASRSSEESDSSHRTSVHCSIFLTCCVVIVLPMNQVLFSFQPPISTCCVCMCLCMLGIYICVSTNTNTQIHMHLFWYLTRFGCILTLRKYLICFLKKPLLFWNDLYLILPEGLYIKSSGWQWFSRRKSLGGHLKE